MEVKIFHSILHTELMPWTLNQSDIKLINERVKKAGANEPVNQSELAQQIKALILGHSNLIKWIDKQDSNATEPLIELFYSTQLPSFYDAFSKYYSLLINKEVLRIFNAFLFKSKKWSNKIDIIYNTNVALKNIKVLIQQISKQIKERQLENTNINELITCFVLFFLKHKLLTLFFSIQEIHKDNLDEIITVENFYLCELNEPVSKIQPLLYSNNNFEQTITGNEPAQNKLSFGFKKEIEKLRGVITQLCIKNELLNEDMCTKDALVNVLTSKNVFTISTSIYLNCETAVFREIIDKFKPFFSNLKLINIEKSKLFYSKNGILITAQNLSSSKIENPKLKEEISRIFKELQ